MKQMSEALSEYLSKEKSLQSCDLYTIRLVDGSVYRFASNDKDVEVDGTLYHRQPFHFRRDQLKLQGAPNVDTLTVTVYTEPQDKLGEQPFMQRVHAGDLGRAQLMLARAYFDASGECVGVLNLFMGLCEVDSAGGIAVKLKVKSEMQGLAAYIPPRVFVGQASYTNQSGTVVSSSTDHTNMLIPLKPSLNVLLQV